MQAMRRAADFAHDRQSCFAVDLRLSDGLSYLIYMGDDLSRFAKAYIAGLTRREKTLLDIAAAKMDEAALSGAPVFVNKRLRLRDSRRAALRGVLLPLSADGRDVTHVFGAANGRGV